MTREEATGLLSGLMFKGKLKEALDMAIKALEQEPTTKNDLGVDCISRQAVLELIADYDLSMGQVVKSIYALPSVTPQKPRWIPVSERSPEAEYGESDSVLVCFENETQDVLYFNGSNWCYPTGETYVSVNHKNDWHNKVIAWMPLPESYRG